MAFDSPHIFSSCCFRSLSSSSYPWLVALWCSSAINASSCPLPRAHSLFGTGYFTALDLFTSSFFPSEIMSTVFLSLHGSSFHHLVLRLPPLSRRSPRITPSLLLSAESFHSLPHLCPPSLLCCSMGNTGNHGEQVRGNHGDLAVVRYEQCLHLLACRGVNWRRDIFVCMIESQGNVCYISPQMLSL